MCVLPCWGGNISCSRRNRRFLGIFVSSWRTRRTERQFSFCRCTIHRPPCPQSGRLGVLPLSLTICCFIYSCPVTSCSWRAGIVCCVSRSVCWSGGFIFFFRCRFTCPINICKLLKNRLKILLLIDADIQK